jgi:two-component system, sensor histidine kinase and response regulator
VSLRFKLLLPLAAFLICSILFLHFIWLPQFIIFEKKELLLHERDDIEFLALSLLPDILVGDLAKIHETLDEFITKRENWQEIEMEDSYGMGLYPIDPSDRFGSGSTYIENYSLLYQEKLIAKIRVAMQFESLIKKRVQKIRILEFALLVILAVVALISILFQELLIRRPLNELAEASGKIAAGDFQVKLPPASNDEIGRFSLAFDNMRKNLQTREGELASSEKWLAAIIENTIDSIITIDTRGKIKSANPATRNIFGYRQDELLGNNISVLMPESHQSLHHSYISNYMRTGVSKIIGKGREVSGRRKDGSIFTMDLSISEMYLNNDHIFLGLIRDITERKQREEILVKFKKAVITAGHAVIITDLDGIIEFVNPAFEITTGYTKEEAIGHGINILKSGAMPASYYEQLWKTILRGEKWDGDVINRRKDGQHYNAHHTIASFPDEKGNIKGFVGIQMDITEQYHAREELLKAKETAEVATKAKSDFLANMSHEIRTPMSAIIGMSHLLNQTRLDSRQQDYLGKIDVSARSLLDIINDILDFSKIEAGMLELEQIDFRLDTVLEKLANIVSILAEEKRLDVFFSTEPELPEILVGDPLRLGQVLLNLVNNAIKFTEKGQIVLQVTWSGESKPGKSCCLKFTIQDTGIGMSTEQAKTLFAPFTQADISSTRTYGGTGLGLAICSQLVQLMGGEISVESTPGKGSIFSFTAGFDHRQSEKDDKNAWWKEFQGTPVLVVDNKPIARRILRTDLELFSFQVTEAASGEDALVQIMRAEKESFAFRAIFIDMHMSSGMDGLATAQKIKINTALKSSPSIIMVTTLGESRFWDQARAAGVDNFMTKPFYRHRLEETLMRVFNCIPASEDRRQKDRHSEFLEIGSIGGARVLLVEDQPINRQVAKEILEGAGLVVEIAENGVEAVERVTGDGETLELVLMDIHMPIMDGYKASQLIRNHEEFQDLPIIALTASVMADDQEKCIRAGMNGCLAKPIDVAKVYDTLLKWIPARQKSKILPQKNIPGLVLDQIDPELEKQLPNFDVAAALERLNGNTTLFRQLLDNLSAESVQRSREIRSALEKEQWETAQRLAHSLKGLAGNLGATAVFHAASELESALKNGKKHVSTKLFSTLDTALAEAAASINALQSRQPAAKDEECSENPPKNPIIGTRVKTQLELKQQRDILQDRNNTLKELNELKNHNKPQIAGENG